MATEIDKNLYAQAEKKSRYTYIDSFLILYYKITRGLASKILILSRAGIELV